MQSWEQIKRTVERREDAHLEGSLAEAELNEGHMVRGVYVVQRARPYLEVIGGMVIGLHAALMTLGFNYLLFVWLLHVNFGG